MLAAKVRDDFRRAIHVTDPSLFHVTCVCRESTTHLPLPRCHLDQQHAWPLASNFYLGKTGLAYEPRTKPIHSRGDLKKHFCRRHLDIIPDGQAIDCPHPECNERLSNKEHTQITLRGFTKPSRRPFNWWLLASRTSCHFHTLPVVELAARIIYLDLRLRVHFHHPC